MTDTPTDRFVLCYMSEDHYHRGHEDDDMRPACRPTRIPGVLSIRSEAERRGLTPCPECWPQK
jgi:hypothetical protein